ncbi:MAG: DUF4878 domain-containing protein [Neisseriaceae bacterium]|nr:DUF4878 domain-containing protein [Neisseriaceae bacterium]
MKTMMHLVWVTLLGLTLVSCGGQPTPEKVAESFVDALYHDKIEQAMGLIYWPEDKADAGAEDMVRGKLKGSMARQAQQTASFGGVASIKAAEVALADGATTAMVYVTVTFNHADAKVKSERVKTIKTDKGWQVDL